MTIGGDYEGDGDGENHPKRVFRRAKELEND